jgi:hypothetical protein
MSVVSLGTRDISNALKSRGEVAQGKTLRESSPRLLLRPGDSTKSRDL